MIRAAADTNILISGILFGGLPFRFLTGASTGMFRMLTSPTLLDELDEKLRLKFKWPAERALRLREELEETCDVISTTESLTIIQADPGDDRVLECAVAGRANFIVSGDRHLLDLGEFRGIPIPTVRQFMERIHPTA